MKVNLVNENFQENCLYNLLSARGVKDIDEFLRPTEINLINPTCLWNIELGAEMLKKHLDNPNSHIVLVVDSDVDGFTSSAIMYHFIKAVKPSQQISYLLHEHKEHGLQDHVDTIAEGDYTLAIMPDSSTNDIEYHRILHSRGIDCLVLDHHEMDESNLYEETPAVIINNQESPSYENKDLTGAGVAWQFCRYYGRAYDCSAWGNLIDLAALGICGDMGSVLSMENRYIMTKGFNNIKNYFFEKAIEKQSFSMGGVVNPTTVAFYIVPLMNAMIRMGTQAEKERLFLALIDGHQKVPSHKRGAKAGTMEEVAVESLRECVNAKSKQTRITDQMVDVMDMRISKYNLLENKILFVRLEDDDDYPPEVVGLCAMKLAAKYKRPTLIGRLNSEGIDRGSIRNVSNCELTDLKAFLNGSGFFEYVQGHANAAGFSIPDANLRRFHEYANEELSSIDFSEGAYDVNFIREADANDLEEMIFDLGSHPEVWGQGNPEALIYVKNIHVTDADIRIMGKTNDTLKIEKNGISYMKFKAIDMIDELQKCNDIKLNIVGKANINNWMGNETPQIFIENYEVIDDLFEF